jgi:galactokinase
MSAGGVWAGVWGGVWRAPGRVNVIGEHTDYNDGFVLPLALAQRVVCTAARRLDGRLVARSARAPGAVLDVSDPAPGRVDGWGAYPAGVVWALRAAGHDVGGLDVTLDGDLPPGAGLSSSAAVCCAVALACNDLYQLGLDRVALARIAQRAENDFVGAPVGIMDQMAVLYGRAGHALFLDTRSLEVRPVPLRLSEAGLALLVIDTHAPHRLVDGEYAARRRSCEQAATMLGVAALRDATAAAVAGLPDATLRRRARHVVTENARVLRVVEALRSGVDPREIGPELTASHESLRDDFVVSCAELDAAVDAALDAGAYGARLTGGGFGGCAIALVNTGGVGTVAQAVGEAFTRRGFAAPSSFVVVPSDGAHGVPSSTTITPVDHL